MKLYIIHRDEPNTGGYCKVGISSKPVLTGKRRLCILTSLVGYQSF